MFFITSFEVYGFDSSWNFKFNRDMFQENVCAPYKTHRLGPLICRFLKADSAESVNQIMQWGISENILMERK